MLVCVCLCVCVYANHSINHSINCLIEQSLQVIFRIVLLYYLRLSNKLWFRWVITKTVLFPSVSYCYNGGTCVRYDVNPGDVYCCCPPGNVITYTTRTELTIRSKVFRYWWVNFFAGFIGNYCEFVMNPCVSTPCQNFGTCLAFKSNAYYSCTCNIG